MKNIVRSIGAAMLLFAELMFARFLDGTPMNLPLNAIGDLILIVVYLLIAFILLMAPFCSD